jgi:ABC-type lipoprotein export system ATPase subunit
VKGTGATFVEARDLGKTYRRGPEDVHALKGVSFSLRSGEVVALIGRSGSGKTTLLNVLCGWERPDSGEIRWLTDGPDTPPVDRRWSELAIVPQGLGLLDELSVRENVEMPLRLGARHGGLDLTQGAPRVKSLLGSLGLDQLADRTPGEVSVGEQQRTALARALVLKPLLLLADEPTGHQDEGWTSRILKILHLAAERGVCCLVATHNRQAMRVADRVLTMRDGEVRADAT